MTKQSKETKEQMIARVLVALGWVGDRYGHYKKTIAGNEYRVKMQSTSLRVERKGGAEWFKVNGAYFKYIEEVNDEKGLGLRLGAEGSKVIR